VTPDRGGWHRAVRRLEARRRRPGRVDAAPAAEHPSEVVEQHVGHRRDQERQQQRERLPADDHDRDGAPLL
jgi:hypothetical protein